MGIAGQASQYARDAGSNGHSPPQDHVTRLRLVPQPDQQKEKPARWRALNRCRALTGCVAPHSAQVDGLSGSRPTSDGLLCWPGATPARQGVAVTASDLPTVADSNRTPASAPRRVSAFHAAAEQKSGAPSCVLRAVATSDTAPLFCADTYPRRGGALVLAGSPGLYCTWPALSMAGWRLSSLSLYLRNLAAYSLIAL